MGVKVASFWKLASWDVSPGTQFSRKPTCKTRTTARYNCLTTYSPSWVERYFSSIHVSISLLYVDLQQQISRQPPADDWETPTVPQPNWHGDWLQKAPTANQRYHLCGGLPKKQLDFVEKSVLFWYWWNNPKTTDQWFFISTYIH